MDPEEVRKRMEEEITAWVAAAESVIGQPLTPGRMIKDIADAFHRCGVPVTHGRLEGDAVVFDITYPEGEG